MSHLAFRPVGPAVKGMMCLPLQLLQLVQDQRTSLDQDDSLWVAGLGKRGKRLASPGQPVWPWGRAPCQAALDTPLLVAGLGLHSVTRS